MLNPGGEASVVFNGVIIVNRLLCNEKHIDIDNVDRYWIYSQSTHQNLQNCIFSRLASYSQLNSNSFLTVIIYFYLLVGIRVYYSLSQPAFPLD